MNNNKIGIFDSGVGGLSVWKELIKSLPYESTIYYADSGNCPYGTKSQEEVIELSKRIVEFFVKEKVKLVVVACNTATAAAIDYLRQNYDIPFVGMEPAVKPAALNTKKGIVGILATEGTFNGRLFNETTEKWASDIDVEIQVGKGFVELVEDGDLVSEHAKEVVKKVLSPLLEKGIDQLVLACTHYPFLYESIKAEIQNSQIEIINPAPAIVSRIKSLLEETNSLISETVETTYEFYSSGTVDVMKSLVHSIYPDIKAEFSSKLL